MKHRLTIFIIILLVFFACAACTNKEPSNQTTEASNSAKSQATQQIQVPTSSPSAAEEPQPDINEYNAITKSEILSFFNSDNGYATNMLQYPAEDMNNLEDVILMILYPLGASENHPISFDDFNKYTMKYLNKSYADSEFSKFVTDDEFAGTIADMEKREIYLSGLGDQDFSIENIEITGIDSALLTCSYGNRDLPETMNEASLKVQFGRANSQLYFISISKMTST